MESVKEKINLAYTIMTTCISLEERFGRHYVSGVGNDAIFEKVSLGWYAIFDGSRESLYFGTEKPWFDKGDKIKVTFQRQ